MTSMGYKTELSSKMLLRFRKMTGCSAVTCGVFSTSTGEARQKITNIRKSWYQVIRRNVYDTKKVERQRTTASLPDLGKIYNKCPTVISEGICSGTITLINDKSAQPYRVMVTTMQKIQKLPYDRLTSKRRKISVKLNSI